MRRSAFGIALCIVGCAPALFAQDPNPNAILMARIRLRAIENLNRMPNYTCTETVERSRRSKATHKYQMLDTIRLEVALVNGKEMFGWPGSTKFEDRDLRDFVTEGAIGNGSFALHARAIFGGEATRFIYQGPGAADDKTWVRFDYDVPLFRSGYTLKVGDASARVAYHGSFDADPKSFDLQRIEVIADLIPAELHLDRTISTVYYARTKIGAGEFLLPTGSEMTMVNVDGTEDRNQIRFASCRQFSGESVVRFDDAPDSATDAPKPPEISEIVLPGGLGLTLALTEEFELANAAKGDPIHARLQNDLKWKGRVLIPKNAIASGRIVRIERSSDVVTIGMMFDELNAPGLRARPVLRLDEVVSTDRSFPPLRPRITTHLQPGEGVIPLAPGRAKLNRGLLMNWSTEAPRP
jgi:hypothetical protein